MTGPFGVLRHRRFRRLQIASLASSTGDWMQITGRAFLVYAVTGSAAAVGAVYLATYLPQLLLLPFAGAAADRFNRRHFVIASSTGQALCAALVAVLAGTGTASLLNLAAVSAVAGALQTLSAPAGMALLPSLVPREAIAGAVSLSVTVANVTRVIGPLLAALTISTAGLPWVFVVNAVSFSGVILVWLLTKVDHVAPTGEQSTLRDIRDGFRYVQATPRIALPVTVLAVLSAIGLVYQPLAVVYATDVLAAGDAAEGSRAYGLLQAALGAGAVVGVLLCGQLLRRPGSALSATGIAFSLSLMALALTDDLGPALVLGVLVGLFHFANSNLVLVLSQTFAPDALRGRVMSIVLLAWIGLIPFTALAQSALAGRFGTRAVFLGSGLVCLLFSLWSVRRRSLLPPVDRPPPSPVLPAPPSGAGAPAAVATGAPST